jgi:eukaryotic-like serine/threonine-protein kinase
MMRPDRWARIKDIFGAAIECAADARGQLLDSSCAGDAELRAELDSLLSAHDTSGGFIDQPAVHAALGIATEAAPSWIGRRLGAYCIVEAVGQGGMSEVYRAIRADDEYQKEVAIKVLRPGLDVASLLRLFRMEKQILANLDHPNIARLLDAGSTEEGQPFLVMDFIKGRPIDEYCERQQLDVPQRLALFRALCGAVQYVHRHLMIHGDLKCSNVLVTDDGVVKLLDFGVAQLLNAGPTHGASDSNRLGLIALTPAYASPEQMSGQPITTASDVYSLGVVLYRMLTGVMPHDDAVSRLRGEMSSIAGRALQKEPEQRYSSVGQLDDDVRNHLTGLPVAAHGAGVGYLLAKFVRRHRVSTTIGALLLVSLVAGILATSWQAHVAHVERARAERHFASVRKLADTLLFDVHRAIEDLPGATAARQTLVQNSLAYLDGLSGEQAGDVELQSDLAAAYEQVAEVQGTRLGDTLGALDSFRKALDIRTRLLASDPANVELRRELVRNYGRLGDMAFFVDDVERALDYANRMLPLAEELARDPAELIDQRGLAYAYTCLGWYRSMSGDPAQGLPLLERGEKILQEQLSAHPESIPVRRSLGVVYSMHGHALRFTTRSYAASLEKQEHAFALLSELTRADPLNADLRQAEAYALLGVGGAMAGQGNLHAAVEKQLQAVTWLRTLLEADPKNDRARFDAARALSESGETLVTLRDRERAEQHLNESLRILLASAGGNAPEMTVERALMAFTYFQLLRLSAQSGDQCRQMQTWTERGLPLVLASERSKTWRFYVTGLAQEAERILGACNQP